MPYRNIKISYPKKIALKAYKAFRFALIPIDLIKFTASPNVDRDGKYCFLLEFDDCVECWLFILLMSLNCVEWAVLNAALKVAKAALQCLRVKQMIPSLHMESI